MALDFSKLTTEVSELTTVTASVVASNKAIRTELKRLLDEKAGEGALQAGIDKLVNDLDASEQDLAASIIEGTDAADEEVAPASGDEGDAAADSKS